MLSRAAHDGVVLFTVAAQFVACSRSADPFLGIDRPVTGDQDLLVVDPFQGIPIPTPAGFLTIVSPRTDAD
jgi:hypothetical protein